MQRTRRELLSSNLLDLIAQDQRPAAGQWLGQVLKGAEYMNIAGELEKHAAEELNHALIISNQIDYLGGMPSVQAKPVRTSEKAKEMLQFDLDNENETIRHYRQRVRQVSKPGYAWGGLMMLES